MATRTFTSAGVNNLWSNAANWDTAPVNNDTVVIASGQTCEFDADLSGWADGVAGLTITGTLKLTRTTGAYYLKIKAATTITGAGTFDCGTSGDPIPFAAKHTITGGAAWYINGGSGLTMTVYAAEPAIKTVYLTGTEAIGSTVLDVDTDVTGDIWAVGDLIHIDDINQAAESEERTIAGGGIAAGAITITAGLTAAKSTGALVHLISRNVKFIGVGATGYTLQNFTANKLTIAGGEWKGAAYRCLAGCTSATISGGTYSGGGTALWTMVTCTISGGIFSGLTNAMANGSRQIVTGGVFSGNSQGINAVPGTTISGGTFTGNNYAVYNSLAVAISGGTFSKNTAGAYICTGLFVAGGTFSNNTQGIYYSSGVVNNAVFSGNTNDINQCVLTLFNVDFSGTTDNTNYTSNSREAYTESFNHDLTAGAFKAWTRGGATASQAGTVPTGYTSAMQTVLENADVEGFWQKEYTVGAGASLNITMNLRKSASMAYLPRCIIFNKASADPFAGGAGIHTFAMTDSVDTWEAETYTYYNSTANDITLVIRFQGKNASGNMFSALLVEQINVDLTAAIAALAVVDANVDAILVDTGTDIPATLTTIDGIVDDILVDTGTTLPASIAGIPDAVHDETFEGTITLRQLERLILAMMAGKASGGGTTTVTFRDQADTKDRITLTVVTTTGDRTGTAVDLT